MLRGPVARAGWLRLFVAAVAFAAIAIFSGMTSPAGAQYAPSCSFTLSQTTIQAGGEAAVHIVGTGFTPNEIFTFYIDGVELAQLQADGDGIIDAVVPLPAEFQEAGEYEITVECPNTLVATNVLTITTTSSTSPPSNLPVTGSDTSMLLIRVAAVLTGIGALLLLAVRYRERSSSLA